jgi:transcription initiation factor IIE alpha subunit
MPISRDEWEKGRTQDTTKARIEHLLQYNRDKAFTSDEISESLFGKPRDLPEIILLALTNTLIVKPVLEKLIEEGYIEAKEVETASGRIVYYAWKVKK